MLLINQHERIKVKEFSKSSKANEGTARSDSPL